VSQWYLQNARAQLDALRRRCRGRQPDQWIGHRPERTSDAVAEPDAIETDTFNKVRAPHELIDARRAAISLSSGQADTKTHCANHTRNRYTRGHNLGEHGNVSSRII
jgi:hypothetical protein